MDELYTNMSCNAIKLVKQCNVLMNKTSKETDDLLIYRLNNSKVLKYIKYNL